MAGFAVVGAFENSSHPPPETWCEFGYDTCADVAHCGPHARSDPHGTNHGPLFRLKLTAVGFEDERIFRRNSPSSALPKTRRCTSPASGFIRPWEAAWQL